MATPALPSHPGPDHQVSVKVLYNDSNRRFKLPLKDLQAQVLPQKLRLLLGVPANVNVIFERYSDSAGNYIRLDEANPSVYKQLYRAAKAKSKLRIKATVVETSVSAPSDFSIPAQPSSLSPPRYSYLETVLSSPIPMAHPESLPATSELSTTSIEVDAFPPQSMQTSVQPPRYRDFEAEDKIRFPVISHSSPNGMFCIDCNNCGRSIANEHYHCSICEYGDYDVCPQCIEAGASCRSDGHWLIKRMVVNGVVTNSTTETIPPRQTQAQAQTEVKAHETPELTEEVAPVQEEEEIKPHIAVCPAYEPSTSEQVQEMEASLNPGLSTQSDIAIQGDEQPMCNGCCREVDESNLVRCNDCEDYDLCLRCLLRNKHGHHPAHTFSLGSDRNFCLKNLIMSRCLPGRQFKHAAICDGCEKRIIGTRHKCLSCPDWDYCTSCIQKAHQNHPGHRFAPIYEAIGEQPRESEVHFGIFCDGPLCKDKPAQSYITGVRYKCAVCDDVDFCASCEAHPNHQHNRTHPLVKFKTPVRTVTVSTITEDDAVPGRLSLGDQPRGTFDSPSVALHEEVEEKKPVVVEQAPVEVEATKPEPAWPAPYSPVPAVEAPEVTDKQDSDNYKAYFVRDAIADGTKLPPNTIFRQTWTLFNPGPLAWPAGSDVRFVGGDTMFNVDSSHPSSVESIRCAMESNKLTTSLGPGQSADFSVTLRTPRREGTAISYWRLKLPNGIPIGHRLWCDIQVQGVVSPTPSVAEPIKKAIEELAETESSTEPSGSGMIFPKLEKESPESSLHEAVSLTRQAPTLSTASEGDVLEDVESLTLDEVSTDAGFLTDEEYDVLDASDQEFLEAKQSIH
ncbi:uncharacterized protein N7496_005238 [Penicillium cataractarum]|uniref:ZZ-type domain-containing protein n=1 Tax=Penicillium cataractarum TaxID=2100454 RepID=A0A9W9VEH2_9EURO|nr:uncharacterized protein N7496_005238 [Penicillium cataractarum]KAJ5377829.1 hypothetical protein N7496_005238 [Penicillium cataractarum]